MHRATYPVRWILVSLATALVIAFAPYLFGGRSFLPVDIYDSMTWPTKAAYSTPQAQNPYFNDGLAQSLPYKQATLEGLRRGRLAYWNTHILCGYPQYAETMGDNFDVLNLLTLLLSAKDAMLWEVILEFFIAGAGLCLLLRYLGVGQLANGIFSAAYMLNSMFVSTSMPRWAVATFCWVPLAILYLTQYLESKELNALLASSIFVALSFFGGNLQSSFYVGVTVGVFALCYTSSSMTLVTRSVVAAGVVALAFLLSAMMWLPTLELFYQTVRYGSVNSSNVYAAYTPLQRILTLPMLVMFYFPSLLGSPESFSIRRVAGLDITNFNGSLGFVVMLFAAWGCVVLWRKKRMQPYIILALLGIVLPIFTPLYTILYHRFFIVSTFAFSVIGAVAFDGFLKAGSAEDRFWKIPNVFPALLVVLGVVVAAGAVWVATHRESILTRLMAMIQASIQQSSFGVGNEAWMLSRAVKTVEFYALSYHVWLPLVLAAVALFALYAYRRGRLSIQAFAIVTGATAILPLILFLWLWYPSNDLQQYPLFPQSSVVQFLQTHHGEGRYAVLRDTARDATILQANCSNIYHIDDFSAYESMTPRTISALVRKKLRTDTLNCRLLGAANVKYIVARSKQLDASLATSVFEGEGLRIYENHFALPRAYLARSVRVFASDSLADARMLEDNWDGGNVVTSDIRLRDVPTSSDGSVSVRDVDPETTEIDARCAQPSLLVLTDTYYPGWTCSVNGRDVPIYRVNHAMRGVVLPPGGSRIQFRFEAGLFTAGLGLNAAAGIAVFIALIAAFIKKKRIAG